MEQELLWTNPPAYNHNQVSSKYENNNNRKQKLEGIGTYEKRPVLGTFSILMAFSLRAAHSPFPWVTKTWIESHNQRAEFEADIKMGLVMCGAVSPQVYMLKF